MAHVQIRSGNEPGTIQVLINGEDWTDRIWRDSLELIVVGGHDDAFQQPALRFTLALRHLHEGIIIKPRSAMDTGLICLIDGVDMSLDMFREIQTVEVDCGEWDELGLRMAIEIDPLDIGADSDVLELGFTDEAFERAQALLASIISESEVA